MMVIGALSSKSAVLKHFLQGVLVVVAPNSLFIMTLIYDSQSDVNPVACEPYLYTERRLHGKEQWLGFLEQRPARSIVILDPYAKQSMALFIRSHIRNLSPK